MQPIENRNPRPMWMRSAPSAMCVATSPPVAILPSRDQRHVVAEPVAPERVVHRREAVDQRQADVVRQRERRGARAAFLPVDGDEVGAVSACLNLSAQLLDLGRGAHHHLQPDGLTGQLAHPLDEIEQRLGVIELLEPVGRVAVLSHRDPANRRDLLRDLLLRAGRRPCRASPPGRA